MKLKDLETLELCAVIEGSQNMPPFFIEELILEISSRCFSRYKTDETEENRKDVIELLTTSVFKSKNTNLADTFALEALQSPKTKEQVGAILEKLSIKNEKLYIEVLNNEWFNKSYSGAVIKSFKTFMLKKLSGVFSFVTEGHKENLESLPVYKKLKSDLETYYEQVSMSLYM